MQRHEPDKSLKLLLEIEELIASHLFDQASSLCDQIISRHYQPKMTADGTLLSFPREQISRALLNRAICFYQLGYLDDALEDLLTSLNESRYLSAPENHGKFISFLSLLLHALCQADALKYLLSKDIPRGELFRLIQMLDFDEQVLIFRKCLDTSNPLGKRFDLKDNQFIKQIKEKLKIMDIEFNENMSLEDYQQRASFLYKNKKYDEAAAEFHKVLQMDPHYMRAYNGRGSCFFLQGKLDLALADFSKAIQIGCVNYIIFNHRGKCYAALGKVDDALIDFTHSLKLNPHYTSSYLNRGIIFKNKNLLADALHDFLLAISNYTPSDAIDNFYLLEQFYIVLSTLSEKNSCQQYHLSEKTIRRGELFRAIQQLPPNMQSTIFKKCLDSTTALGKRFHSGDAKFKRLIEEKLSELSPPVSQAPKQESIFSKLFFWTSPATPIDEANPRLKMIEGPDSSDESSNKEGFYTL